MRRTIAVAVGVLMLGAAPIDAQEPEALSKGTTSLAFTLPQSGSSTAGIWRFLTDGDALGIMVSFEVNRHDVVTRFDDVDATSWGIGAGPAYKHYFTPKRRVAPFAYSSASVNWHGADTSIGPDASQWRFGAKVGLGADWFPVEEISLGGFVGLHGSYGKVDRPEGTDQSSWSLGTMTSAISAHIYF